MRRRSSASPSGSPAAIQELSEAEAAHRHDHVDRERSTAISWRVDASLSHDSTITYSPAMQNPNMRRMSAQLGAEIHTN